MRFSLLLSKSWTLVSDTRQFAKCFSRVPLFSQLIGLAFPPCHLGWPNPTAHLSPIGEGGYSPAAVAARSVSKCSHNFWVHRPPPCSPRRAWGRGLIPFGSWRIFVYYNKGMKTSLGILLCPSRYILLVIPNVSLQFLLCSPKYILLKIP